MNKKNFYKKILVVRTDRIGDVVLSTPVLEALRDNFPASHIAVMVNPQTKEIVENNPYVNEVIVYDKDKKDGGVLGFWKFVIELKRKKFDLAVVLHTKKRTNIIAYLADIPRRAGYRDSKFGFLLTDKIEDSRHCGLKHEADYCLDILRKIGLKLNDKYSLCVPVRKDCSDWAEAFLKTKGVCVDDKVAGLHAGASCASKRWPRERFVSLADRLAGKYGFKVILVAQGKEDVAIANSISGEMRRPVINLAGELSLLHLGGVLKRCSVFISNDSGPVHLASAIGTPVISIFGRNQAGLGPVRWGPLGDRSRYLHKGAGCSVCLAHNCKRGFDCLKAITVDDVLKAVDDIAKP